MVRCAVCGVANNFQNTLCIQCGTPLNAQQTQPGADEKLPRQSPLRQQNRGFSIQEGGSPAVKPTPSTAAPTSVFNRSTPIKSHSPKSRTLPLLYSLAGILVVAVVLWLVWKNQSQKDIAEIEAKANALFVHANQLYNDQQYLQAFQAFSKLANEHPKSPLAQLANQKADDIRIGHLTIVEQKTAINSQLSDLLSRAKKSFEMQRYLVPEDDNAFSTILKILQIDPNNAQAIEMLEEIKRFYASTGDRAQRSGRYNSAIEFYENYLIISPNDPEILYKIDETKALLIAEKRAVENRKSFNNLKAQQDSDDSKIAITPETPVEKEPAISANQTRTSSSPTIANRTQPLPSDKVLENTPSANNTNRPTAINSSGSVPSSKPATQLLPNPTPSNSTDFQPLTVVSDTLLDQPVRLIKKAKPRNTKVWDIQGFTEVRAICLVNESGIVESVELIEPSSFEWLNTLSIETLTNYRYQPGTYKGKPIKFKTIQTLIYR